MTKVFIGGSRRIARLSEDVRGRLARIVSKRLPIVVGDANGADRAVQEYLHDRQYELVEVFCAGEECRNNVGNWVVRKVSPSGKRKDFDFYATKDRVMAQEASVGLMLWDGKSVGTLMNVLRLVSQAKKAAVYVAPTKAFFDLKSKADLIRFVSELPLELRERVHEQAEEENKLLRTPVQATLLSRTG